MNTWKTDQYCDANADIRAWAQERIAKAHDRPKGERDPMALLGEIRLIENECRGALMALSNAAQAGKDFCHEASGIRFIA